ncbi:MAG TPA: nitrite reductase small subunit NirD [Alphaproteobacteria bacterium]|nr:nitrite reductase small subunit NirD [Alphaproteobacteria bacterium]
MTAWIAVGRLDDIPRLGARVVRTSKGNIAVFRTADDRVFALDDRCPHKGGPLSQGIVHGGRITCPLHNWVVELCDGRAVAPDEGCTVAYPVRLEDGVISICLDAAASRAA